MKDIQSIPKRLPTLSFEGRGYPFCFSPFGFRMTLEDLPGQNTVTKLKDIFEKVPYLIAQYPEKRIGILFEVEIIKEEKETLTIMCFGIARAHVLRPWWRRFFRGDTNFLSVRWKYISEISLTDADFLSSKTILRLITVMTLFSCISNYLKISIPQGHLKKTLADRAMIGSFLDTIVSVLNQQQVGSERMLEKLTFEVLNEPSVVCRIDRVYELLVYFLGLLVWQRQGMRPILPEFDPRNPTPDIGVNNGDTKKNDSDTKDNDKEEDRGDGDDLDDDTLMSLGNLDEDPEDDENK